MSSIGKIEKKTEFQAQFAEKSERLQNLSQLLRAYSRENR